MLLLQIVDPGRRLLVELLPFDRILDLRLLLLGLALDLVDLRLLTVSHQEAFLIVVLAHGLLLVAADAAIDPAALTAVELALGGGLIEDLPGLGRLVTLDLGP